MFCSVVVFGVFYKIGIVKVEIKIGKVYVGLFLFDYFVSVVVED